MKKIFVLFLLILFITPSLKGWGADQLNNNSDLTIEEQELDLDSEEEINETEEVKPEEETKSESIVILKESSDKYTYKYLTYERNQKYYLTPNNLKIKDLRKTGPLNPTLFDLVRTDAFGEKYIENEKEEGGCNLEEAFRKTIFQSYGVNIRRYLNALYVASCDSLGSAEEKALCNYYKETPACQGTELVAFLALPLNSQAETYLTTASISPFSCTIAKEKISANNYVPKESAEWDKIKSDLVDKQRKTFVANLKNNVPTTEIRNNVLSQNPSASERDIQFAIQDYIFEKGNNFTAEISDPEIQSIVESRYAPFGVMESLKSFSLENASSCAKMNNRYWIRTYGEVINIPPHLLLVFNDYIAKNNSCLCN